MPAEPRNEEEICQAIVRLLHGREGGPLTITDRPDKVERREQAVEMLFESPSIKYAMEHTRIESFTSQISDGVLFAAVLEPLEALLSPKMPGHFTLTVPVGATTPIKVSEQQRTRDIIADWVLRKAPTLNTKGHGSSVTERPNGIPFDVTLHGHESTKKRLLIARFMPDNLERLRRERVATALARKCPKLAKCKAENRTTVLVLESNDIALGNSTVIGETFAAAMSERTDHPDHVFLVETETRPWYVWTLKRGADVYPSQRVLDLDFDTL